MPGLAAVDGLVLKQPVAESYRAGLSKNVSVIISNMAQECGAGPGATMPAAPSAFKAELAKLLAFTKANVCEVLDVYKTELSAYEAHGHQRVYDSMTADAEVGCGNKMLALALAGGRKPFASPPVFSVVNSIGSEAPPFACHVSDLNSVMHGKDAAAVQLRVDWVEFASSGTVKRWMPVLTPAGPASTILFSNYSATVAPTVCVDCKWRQCALWAKTLPPAPAFWWSN